MTQISSISINNIKQSLVKLFCHNTFVHSPLDSIITTLRLKRLSHIRSKSSPLKFTIPFTNLLPSFVDSFTFTTTVSATSYNFNFFWLSQQYKWDDDEYYKESDNLEEDEEGFGEEGGEEGDEEEEEESDNDNDESDLISLIEEFDEENHTHAHTQIEHNRKYSSSMEWDISRASEKKRARIAFIKLGRNIIDFNSDIATLTIGPIIGETTNDYLIRCLMKYKELHGNMLVPGRYIVPSTDIWPMEMWQKKLGISVQLIRAGKVCPNKKADLTALGFDFNKQSTKRRGKDVCNTTISAAITTATPVRRKKRFSFETVIIMLLRHKELHGDMLVNQSFNIPSTEEWPQDMWNYNLGQCVSDIRRKKRYVDKEKELLTIEFPFNNKAKVSGFNIVKDALETYKKLHNNLEVPGKFVIPTEEKWHENLWGVNIGLIVRGIRYRRNYKEHHDELKAMGFRF